MNPIHNPNGKRIFDISEDKQVIEIKQKNCITRITVNVDGTLQVTHELTAA